LVGFGQRPFDQPGEFGAAWHVAAGLQKLDDHLVQHPLGFQGDT
jgi:hypothetical protein